MRFEARELKHFAVPVSPEELRSGETYFAVLFVDDHGLIPARKMGRGKRRFPTLRENTRRVGNTCRRKRQAKRFGNYLLSEPWQNPTPLSLKVGEAGAPAKGASSADSKSHL